MNARSYIAAPPRTIQASSLPSPFVTHRMNDVQSNRASAALVWSQLRHQLRRATVRW